MEISPCSYSGLVRKFGGFLPEGPTSNVVKILIDLCKYFANAGASNDTVTQCFKHLETFSIIGKKKSFYCNNLGVLSPKPKLTLNNGVQNFKGGLCTGKGIYLSIEMFPV